ncbi:MAG: phosphotransferase family protein [Aureispira sp.]|nr:phosphotransferase family protein [Aureispira sp.]
MSNKIIDQPRDVRKGEEIDADVISNYLRQHIPNLEGTANIKQFKGGASNLTYQLDFGQESYILRRPPIGTKAKSAHNMEREHDIMNRLKPHYPTVPKMLLHCADESIIGSEFYVMEKLRGFIPRASLPKELELSKPQVQPFCKAAVDKLIELHKIDYKEAGFESYYRGEGYVERQVKGWSKRYKKAQTPDVPDYEFVMDWLHKEMPKDIRTCIIHNDFRFDNLVYDADDLSNVIGVLDWELATVGDPLMDLGSSMAYWIEAKDPKCLQLMRPQPTNLDGMMTRDELAEYYLKEMGFGAVNMKYYYVFGIFRLAVIAQQIYYRFYHKQTTNKKFVFFGVAVQMLERYCQRLIKSKSNKLSQYPMTTLDNLKFTSKLVIKKVFG